MRLTITTNQGTVIEVINDLEEYDLNSLLARADICEDIFNAIRIGKKIEAEEPK